MRTKWKYKGAILGTVIGLACAWWMPTFKMFWVESPIPLAIIGYATGALLDDEKPS